MSTTLNITDLTNNVATNSSTFAVTGSGMFDKLMETANTHIKAQYDAGRLRGEDYANIYSTIYVETLKLAVTAWLQKPVSEVQTDLYSRQIEGFNETYREKIFKDCLDTWSVFASLSASATSEVPYCITKTSLDSLYGSTSSTPYTYTNKTVADDLDTSVTS